MFLNFRYHAELTNNSSRVFHNIYIINYICNSHYNFSTVTFYPIMHSCRIIGASIPVLSAIGIWLW